LVDVGAFNLSLILRQVLGAGTPREWRNRGHARFASLSPAHALGSSESALQKTQLNVRREILRKPTKPEYAVGHAGNRLSTPRAVRHVIV